MNKFGHIFSSIYPIRFSLLAFIVLIAGLLFIYGIKGFYSRYAQDDYCYGYRVKFNGFWNAQVESYFGRTEYSSDRYSLTLLYGINEEIGGPKFIPYLPGLEILGLVGGLTYLIYSLFKPTRQLFLSVMAATILSFFTFYLSPNRYQNLFWLSAIHTYLTPIVLTILMIALIIQMTLTRKLMALNVMILGFLGLLAGGFSETTTIWQVSIWSLAIVGLFIFNRKLLFTNAKEPLITALAASILAAILMIINPSNSVRGAHYQHAGFLSIITQSLFFGEEFIRVSVKAAPLPFSVILLFGFWLSASQRLNIVPNARKYILAIVATILVVFLLCVATMVPYLYVMGVYPGDRALFPAHFGLVCGLFAVGWFLPKLILSLWPKVQSLKVSLLLFVLIGIGLFAYMARALPRVYRDLPLFQARAQAWDARQQMILDAKAAGESEIIIPQFDSIYGITELKTDSNNWINLCAAKYYGVESISAVDGYLGSPSYSIGR